MHAMIISLLPINSDVNLRIVIVIVKTICNAHKVNA